MDLQKIIDSFIESASQQEIVENPPTVIRQVFSWTNKDLYLTEQILQLILKHNFQILNGEEENRIKEFVNTYITKNWECNEAAKHLNPIRDQIPIR